MATSTPTVFVSGVTGCQGGAVCQELLKFGWNVRGITRDPSSPQARALLAQGVHLTHGDWDNDGPLAEALAGCDKIYLCMVSNFKDYTEAPRRAQKVAQLAKAAGVKHAVVSTTLGLYLIDQPPAIPPSDLFAGHIHSRYGVEKAVTEGGFDKWTALRPSFFMANYLEPKIRMGFTEIQDGVWTNCMEPDTLLGLVDHQDIGRFAAAALKDTDTYHGRTMGVTSEHLRVEDMLNTIAEACGDGRSIKPIFLSDEEIAKLQAEKSRMFFAAEPCVRNMVEYVDMDELNRLSPEGMTTFKSFLEREKDLVQQTYVK
jgi:uncharacterized protein YbjT (DUF2867 family)